MLREHMAGLDTIPLIIRLLYPSVDLLILRIGLPTSTSLWHPIRTSLEPRSTKVSTTLIMVFHLKSLQLLRLSIVFIQLLLIWLQVTLLVVPLPHLLVWTSKPLLVRPKLWLCTHLVHLGAVTRPLLILYSNSSQPKDTRDSLTTMMWCLICPLLSLTLTTLVMKFGRITRVTVWPLSSAPTQLESLRTPPALTPSLTLVTMPTLDTLL